MSTRRKLGNRQPELFARSTKPVIALEMNHRLVRLTHELDWTELEEVVEEIRARKLKNAAGRPPHLRALIGAVVFRATRRITYRETEDQIRHYAPARYLCGLTETEWSPDANTIQDFEELLGEDGMKRLNEYVVTEAVEERLADPKLLVADTTAGSRDSVPERDESDGDVSDGGRSGEHEGGRGAQGVWCCDGSEIFCGTKAAAGVPAVREGEVESGAEAANVADDRPRRGCASSPGPSDSGGRAARRRWRCAANVRSSVTT